MELLFRELSIEKISSTRANLLFFSEPRILRAEYSYLLLQIAFTLRATGWFCSPITLSFCVLKFTDAGVLMADTTYGNLAVGEGVRMQGNLSVPGEAVVDGQVLGILTAQSVFVTDNGAIQGTTTADHVRVAGKISETTVANKTLLIESTGVATGEIAYADLEIRKGGDIQGNIRIIQRPA
jgi:cytoskeletal protein CcmA (bactofilin family)